MKAEAPSDHPFQTRLARHGLRPSGGADGRGADFAQLPSRPSGSHPGIAGDGTRDDVDGGSGIGRHTRLVARALHVAKLSNTMIFASFYERAKRGAQDAGGQQHLPARSDVSATREHPPTLWKQAAAHRRYGVAAGVQNGPPRHDRYLHGSDIQKAPDRRRRPRLPGRHGRLCSGRKHPARAADRDPDPAASFTGLGQRHSGQHRHHCGPHPAKWSGLSERRVLRPWLRGWRRWPRTSWKRDPSRVFQF